MTSSAVYPPRSGDTPHLSSVASTPAEPSVLRSRFGLGDEHHKQVEEESRRCKLG